MKKILTIALGFTMASTALAETKFLRLGTGGAGGTYYPLGGVIANAISNPPGSRPCDKGGRVASKDWLLLLSRLMVRFIM